MWQAINGAAKSNNNAVAPNADPITANRIVQAGDYAQKSAPLQAADASGTVRNTFVSSQLNARGNPAVRALHMPLLYDPSAHAGLHFNKTAVSGTGASISVDVLWLSVTS